MPDVRNSPNITWRVEAAEHIFGDDRPFAQCHASTLVELPNGEFLTAWFGGTKEKHPDVGIWMSRCDGGKWSPPNQAAKIRQSPHWNPVLLVAPDGNVFLFFKVGDQIAVWETWLTVSADGGQTWSAPQELVVGDRGGRGPVKNKPIFLSDGAWLAPASIEPRVNNKPRWDVLVDRSEDGGRTWRSSSLVPLDHGDFPGAGVIQPTLWESAPGKVHMLMRSSCCFICRSDSEDGGRTWRQIYRTALPNNNSGLDLTRLADGSLVLIYNPINGDWAARTPLSLAVSFDNGLTWTAPHHIETEPGEYSYPAIIPSGDGAAATYTWRRERIAFWKGSFQRQENHFTIKEKL